MKGLKLHPMWCVMAEGRRTLTVLTSEVKERLETMTENVTILVKQIKNGIATYRTTITSLQEFHRQFRDCIQTVSDICTKLSVLFVRPPCPSLNETGILCSKLETATLNLTSTYCQCNEQCGKYFLKAVKVFVIDVLEAIVRLGRLLMSEGCQSDSVIHLQGTGSLWEHCDNVEKLPLDNKSAAVKVCLTQLHLLRDANEEMNELVKRNGSRDDFDTILKEMLTLDLSSNSADNDSDVIVDSDDSEDEWNGDDIALAKDSIDLINLAESITDRGCRVILKYGTANELYNIEQLDQSTDIILQLSPHVDELASVLEAPIDHVVVSSHFSALYSVLSQCVDCLSGCHFCSIAKDEEWPQKDYKARLHKLKPIQNQK